MTASQKAQAKAVLISIRPRWCKKIMDGEKTIELRKTKPRIPTPFKCYIYCTSGRPDLNIQISQEQLMQDYLNTGSMKCLNCPLGNGKVIGEFICNNIYKVHLAYAIDAAISEEACVSPREIHEYLKGKTGYGWSISDLKIYYKPLELSYFRKSMECPRGKQREDCARCWDCEITRPPQSWCYVEENE